MGRTLSDGAPRSARAARLAAGLALWAAVGLAMAGAAAALPLEAELLDRDQRPVGKLLVYIDYIEVLGPSGEARGKVGIVNVDGDFMLYLAKADGGRDLVGRAWGKKLYDAKGELAAHYDWTSFWVYAYDTKGAFLGRAKCIAYQGLCAAGAAAALAGMFGWL